MEENAVWQVYAERECPPGCVLGVWEYMENGKPDLLFLLPTGPDTAKAMRFLARELEKAGVIDWLMVLSCLCNTGRTANCRKNIEKLLSITSPKIIAPCGNAAFSLFGIREAGLFLFRMANGYTSAIIPFCDPRDLLKDSGENVANYLDFTQVVNDIRVLSFMLQNRRPDAAFFTENGVEFTNLSSDNHPEPRYS